MWGCARQSGSDPRQRRCGTVPLAGWGSRVGGQHRFCLTEKHGEGTGEKNVMKSPWWRFPSWRNKKKTSHSEKDGSKKQQQQTERKRTEKEARQTAAEVHELHFVRFTWKWLSSFASIHFKRLWFTEVRFAEADFFRDLWQTRENIAVWRYSGGRQRLLLTTGKFLTCSRRHKFHSRGRRCAAEVLVTLLHFGPVGVCIISSERNFIRN